MKSKNRTQEPSCGSDPFASASGGPFSPSRRSRASSLAVALLGTATLASVHAAEWLNETFEGYTLGAVPDSTTSPLLTNVAGTTVVSGNGGNMARIVKSQTTDPAVNLQYQLSSGYATPRPRGFISFKVNRNDDAGIPTSQYCTFGLGANVSGTLGSDASRIIGIRFYQTSSTSNFRVYSGGTQVGSNGTYDPTDTVQTVRIWYNDDDALTMAYVDPSGGNQTLATNSFVVYLGNTLMTPSASGSPLAGGAGADLNIGKLNFTGTSSSALDMSVDEIYAGDSAPAAGPAVIISPATADAFVGVPFSYQIVADGATSFTATGLPGTLSLNTSTGEITGTPDTAEVINAVLTATSPGGTSDDFNLAITVTVPAANEFTGTNPSLNTSSSWSLNSAPNSSINVGSYKDLVLNSSVTTLTSSATNLYARSWNVENGATYTLDSSASTSYKLGNSGNPDVSPFTNIVSGVQNDLVYLSNGSNLTFLSSLASPVQMRNSGNFNIGAGSVLDMQAVLDDNGTLSLTKTGEGQAILGAVNTYAGGTTVAAGTLTLGNAGALGTGTLTLAGGTLQSMVNVSLNYDTSSSYTVTIDGPVTLDAAVGTTVTLGRLTTTNPSALNVMTKEGDGTLALTGTGSAPLTVAGGYRVKAGTLFYNTSSNANAGVGPLVMDGGNATFTKAASSGFALFGLSILQDTTMTLDPDPATPSGSNTVSFNHLDVGSRTIHVVKGSQALSSEDTIGYEDPELIFNSASLTGTVTFNTDAYTAVSLETADGTGGVIKTGGGRISIGNQLNSAAASAQRTGDAVTYVAVTNGGRGYTSPPTVTFDAPVSGTTATATAILTGDMVTGLTITDPGSGYTSTPGITFSDPETIVPNTYTGATVINAGTLALGGVQASPVSVNGTSVLELDLAAPVTSSASLSLAAGAKVRITGTPTLPGYTLVTASSVTDSPVLESPIAGYELVRIGNTYQLNSTAGGGYTSWAATNAGGQAAGLDFDNDGMSNGVEYFMGATGSSFTPNPSIVTAGAVRTITWPKDPAFVGTFMVQISDSLAPGGWTDIVPPNASIDESNPNQVVYTLPTGSQKKFSRLKVVVP